jgi:PAS domain S-box-containing protein
MNNQNRLQARIEFDLDLSGRITAVSPVVERTIGYHAEELIGQPFVSLVHFEDLVALRQRWDLAINGQAGSHELRLLGKWGDIHKMLAQSRPIFENGRAVGLTETMTDLPEPSRN